MFDLKPFFMVLLIVTSANAEDATSFVEKLKEHSKQMMPIQYDVELSSSVKPRFDNMEDSLKYWTKRMNYSVSQKRRGGKNIKPSESDLKAIIEKNASSFVTGCTSTMYQKCKSFDSHNYLLEIIDGESNTTIQMMMSDEVLQYAFDPECNNLALNPPSPYTREMLSLFEHERAYNFINKGLRIETKGDDIYLYVSMYNEKDNYIMKFKKGDIGFPFEIVNNNSKGHINYYYSGFRMIDGIKFPTQIKVEQYNHHEVTNKLCLRYVMIQTFTNIKIDKSLKKDDIDFMVPPDTSVHNYSNKDAFKISNSKESVSVKKSIKR